MSLFLILANLIYPLTLVLITVTLFLVNHFIEKKVYCTMSFAELVGKFGGITKLKTNIEIFINSIKQINKDTKFIEVEVNKLNIVKTNVDNYNDKIIPRNLEEIKGAKEEIEIIKGNISKVTGGKLEELEKLAEIFKYYSENPFAFDYVYKNATKETIQLVQDIKDLDGAIQKIKNEKGITPDNLNLTKSLENLEKHISNINLPGIGFDNDIIKNINNTLADLKGEIAKIDPTTLQEPDDAIQHKDKTNLIEQIKEEIEKLNKTFEPFKEKAKKAELWQLTSQIMTYIVFILDIILIVISLKQLITNS